MTSTYQGPSGITLYGRKKIRNLHRRMRRERRNGAEELETPRDGRKDWYGSVCLSSQLLKMLRQEDCKFKVSLSYVGSPCLKVKVGCTSPIEHLLSMLKNLGSVPSKRQR